MSAPVETKVKAAGLTSLVAAFAVAWIVTTVPGLSGVAEPLQAAIVAIVTAASAGAAGWLAEHTPRPPSPM